MEHSKRSKASTFEELEVWRKAHQAVLSIYRLSGKFPTEERFSLTSQLRRAAASVTANIAEGFLRVSTKEKAHLLNVSQGSLSETRNYLILARDLGFADTSTILTELIGVAKMLNAYRGAVIRNHRGQ